MATSKKWRLIDIRHPVWSDCHADWMTYRLVYEGGAAFIDAFLLKYSRREGKSVFAQRKELTYNPSHTTTCLNMYRDAMMSKSHEIIRTGDPVYKEIVSKNVDQSNNSMDSFMGLQFIPWLMAQQRRFIIVDAPPKAEGTTKDEDKGRPFIWAVNAENVLAWKMEAGKFTKILILEMAECEDPATGLAVGTEIQYRYMELVPAGTGEIQVSKDYSFTPVSANEDCVMVRLLDPNGKDKVEPYALDIPRVPVVMGELVESMVKNSSKIQIGLLNLNSTDMMFLFKGNFPLYVENRDKAQRVIPPRATKKAVRNMEKVDLEDREVDEDDTSHEKKEVGVNDGVSYGKDLQPPSFIAPPTENCTLSMAKQEAMKAEIRVLLDMALVSMANKALQQSGDSKEMDRVGLDKGLSYIGSVCENVERDVAEIIHLFLKSAQKYEVKYPTDYSLKTKGERIAEANALQPSKTMIRSEKWQKKMSKSQARIVMTGSFPSAEIEEVEQDIEATVWFDESIERSTMIGQDILNGVLSKETGCELRGFPEGEFEKIEAEGQSEMDALTGGPNVPVDKDGNPVELDENGDPVDPSAVVDPADPTNTPVDPEKTPTDAPVPPFEVKKPKGKGGFGKGGGFPFKKGVRK